jgi:hypothetical protein
LQRSVNLSQSHLTIEQEDEDDEDKVLTPMEDVESDSQGPEEEEDDEFETKEEVEVLEDVGSDDDASDRGEVEPISEGLNQQQQMTSSTAA